MHEPEHRRSRGYGPQALTPRVANRAPRKPADGRLFIFPKVPFPTFRAGIHEYSQAFNSPRLSNYLKIRITM
ncbi:protein of unknown function [Burkholderia multivorans]